MKADLFPEILNSGVIHEYLTPIYTHTVIHIVCAHAHTWEAWNFLLIETSQYAVLSVRPEIFPPVKSTTDKCPCAYWAVKGLSFQVCKKTSCFKIWYERLLLEEVFLSALATQPYTSLTCLEETHCFMVQWFDSIADPHLTSPTLSILNNFFFPHFSLSGGNDKELESFINLLYNTWHQAPDKM